MQKYLFFSSLGKYLAMGQVVASLVAISMAYFGYSYWALIFSQILGAICQAVLIIFRMPIKFKIITFVELKETYLEVSSLIKNITGFNTINYWARNADNLLIGKIYGEDTLGIYNYAYKLLMLPQGIISSVFSQTFLPSFKKSLSENKDFDFQKEVISLLGGVSIVVFPVSLIFLLCPEFLVMLIAGEAWMEVAVYLPYFGLLLVQQSMISFTGYIFVLLNAENALFKIGVVNAIILVVAIVIGGLISVEMLVLCYLTSYSLIAVPILLKFGFVDKLGFGKNIYIYWIGKVATFIPLTVCIWFHYQEGIWFFSIFTAFLYVFSERNSISMLTRALFKKN